MTVEEVNAALWETLPKFLADALRWFDVHYVDHVGVPDDPPSYKKLALEYVGTHRGEFYRDVYAKIFQEEKK